MWLGRVVAPTACGGAQGGSIAVGPASECGVQWSKTVSVASSFVLWGFQVFPTGALPGGVDILVQSQGPAMDAGGGRSTLWLDHGKRLVGVGASGDSVASYASLTGIFYTVDQHHCLFD